MHPDGRHRKRSLLVLLDVDGTLLLSHDDVYAEASRAALLDVYGLAPEGPDRPGDTAPSHVRRALRSAGQADPEIDAGLESWCKAMSEHYLRLLAEADTSYWRVAPGAATTLARLERPALLTGNPEPVARARMERIGLARFFPHGQGAFGCEREDRVELFDLARRRAGDWPAELTVGVGDTPLDVSSARAAGVRCIAIASGAFSPAELAAADAVIGTFAGLPDALAGI